MAELRVETFIDAPREICFDLLRDPRILADAEAAGPFSLGQSVTFHSRLLGLDHELHVKVVKFDRPRSFVDQMTRGRLRSFVHIHELEDDALNGRTRLIDTIRWESPFGFLGKAFDALILTKRMRKLVVLRNKRLNVYALR